MLKITIDRKAIKNITDFKKVLDDELLQAYWKSTFTMQANIARLAPTATGLLRNSITSSTPRISTFGIVGGVFSSLAYAIPVDTGSRPHFPPVKPLKDWVKIKFRIGYDDKANDRIAWGVARKIAREGTKPTNFFSRGLESSIGSTLIFFEQAVANAIRKSNEN
jgi:hypothetical protein